MKIMLCLVLLLCTTAIWGAIPHKRVKLPMPPTKVQPALSPRAKAQIIKYAIPVPPQTPPPPFNDRYVVLSFPASYGTVYNVYRRDVLGIGGWTLYDQPKTNIVAYWLDPTKASAFYAVTATQNVRTVTLAWDPSASSGIAGYKLYSGVASRNYTNSANAGSATTLTVSNLVPRNTYYFAATAYDTNGIESDYSGEVNLFVPTPTNFPVRTSIKMAPDAPNVTTLAATNATSSTAVARGTVNSNGGDAVATMFFYGTNAPGTTNFQWRSIAVIGTNTASYQSIALSNLSSASTYYYCFAAENAAGLRMGNTLSFATVSAPVALVTSAMSPKVKSLMESVPKAKFKLKEAPRFSPLPPPAHHHLDLWLEDPNQPQSKRSNAPTHLTIK
jgi:hypothetical protein